MLIVLTLVALLPPYLTKLAFDKGIMARNMNVLIRYVFILVGTYLLQSILNYSSSVLFTFLNQHTLLDMKKDLNKSILNLPLEIFSSNTKKEVNENMNDLNPEYIIEGFECAGCFFCSGCLLGGWSALMLIGLATMVYVG